jgi:phage/plasmid-like protein (TIGR03299 family)
VRVVCQNTLSFAFDDVKQQQRRNFKVDHTRKFDPSHIKESLGLIDKAWSTFLARINAMTLHQLRRESAQSYFESLFLSEKAMEEGRLPSSAKYKEINQITSLFRSARGQTLETAEDTLWGAVNAVSYYTDHVRATKSGQRIDSAWFGAGALLKEKAWQRAISLMQETRSLGRPC